MVYIGEVIGIHDKNGADRIYVYIAGLDNDKYVNDNKLAFPLLPKFFFVKPKIGENVVIIAVPSAEGDPMVRLYIGPIISQPQDMLINTGAQSLVGMGLSGYGFKRNPHLTPGCEGSFAKDNEVALYSREKSDIIMGDDSVRIRCGSRLYSYDSHGATFKFNTINSAFMHMKYYEQPLMTEKIGWDDGKKKLIKKDSMASSVATISAEEINLISSPNLPLESSSKVGSEMLSDHQIGEIIKEGHPIVYGDKLVEILDQFREAIYNHIHDWGPSNAKDHPTPEIEKLGRINFGEMLSENIRAI